MSYRPDECRACGDSSFTELGSLGQLCYWRCDACGLDCFTDGDPDECELYGVEHNIPPEYYEA